MLLVVTDDRYLDHDAGAGHPERPDRLRAALQGVRRPEFDGAVAEVAPRAATDEELRRVHRDTHLDRIAALDAAGGGRIDLDTVMSAASRDAAVHAAGAVLTAVETLREGVHDAAYCVVRPPGHHATPDQAMGFCVFNSVAVAAAELVAAGQRVAIVDVDAHHGNGTQDAFYESEEVLFGSIHESPQYPGTGAVTEVGVAAGQGFTVNVPVPPGTTGDIARAAFDTVIGPAVDDYEPDWLLVSAGYDGHEADPVAGLAYAATDVADVIARCRELVDPSRLVVVLEGGYDLGAVAASSAAVTGMLVGERYRPDRPTTGGPGRAAVERARSVRRDYET